MRTIQTRDISDEQLEFLVNQLGGRQYVSAQFLRYCKDLERAIGHPASQGGKLDEDQVFTYLTKCREFLEDFGKKLASSYTPVRWLWYLRRLPRAITAGSLRTTGPYDLLLSEMIANIYGADANRNAIMNRAGQMYFDINDVVAKRVLNLCTCAILLAHVHAMIRWCGKGVHFTAGRTCIPDPKATEQERNAVSLYDRRIEALGTSRMALGIAGTILTEPTDALQGKRDFDFLALLANEERSINLPIADGIAEPVMLRYTPVYYSLVQLHELNAKVGRS